MFRLRQAAIRSSETKRTIENNETASENEEEIKTTQMQKFENFDQFKKYKQKLRDEGRTEQSLIVSIPNITGTV
jgi:hypothetical protein